MCVVGPGLRRIAAPALRTLPAVMASAVLEAAASASISSGARSLNGPHDTRIAEVFGFCARAGRACASRQPAPVARSTSARDVSKPKNATIGNIDTTPECTSLPLTSRYEPQEPMLSMMCE